MEMLKCSSIGEAWIESCRIIFAKGARMIDGNEKIREATHFFLEITNPSENDKVIEKHGDKEMINWMNSNFTEQKKVPELKNGWSYGKRLFDYSGKDQVAWIVKKLKEKPETKSATIPLIMHDDEGYIPCVSMLDFKIRNSRLMITAMCRSIDFGNKVYANMIALHKLQKSIAEQTGVKPGELIMYAVSAHIYEKDYEKIKNILEAE